MPLALVCPLCGVAGTVTRDGRRTTFEPYAEWRRTCTLEQGLSGPLQCPHLRSRFVPQTPAAARYDEPALDAVP